MSKYVFARLLLSLISLLLPASAQMTRGTLTGTVTDPSGAVVPAVSVKAVNLLTNIVRETKTNDAGIYRIPALDPGSYTVEFQKDGFEPTKISGIELKTSQEITLNPQLKVGAATTAVEVVEGSVGVELSKSTATVERTFQAKVISEVPLTAGLRDVNQLALLAPTATRAPGSTGISANGQRARNNNFMLDGSDNNDPSVTIANLRIIPEAVAEFQVQTSAYSAEFGRSSGGQLTAITRSGTNQFRGEVYDYLSSNALDPQSLLNKRAGLTANPRSNRNQAGGALGGPVMRNKTFFFALLEANRFRQAADARNSSNATIPTPEGFTLLRNLPLGPDQPAASRQAMLDSLGFLTQIYGQNPRFVSPRTVAVNGVNIPVGQINIPLANPSNFWYAVGRVDHMLTSRDSLNYRYIIDDRNQPDVTSNLQFGTLFSASQAIRRQNHVGSWTRTIRANLVNEFRYSFVRGSLAFPENDPRSATTNITGLFTIGGLSNFPQGRQQWQNQFQNTTTYTVGRHSLKFGMNLNRIRLFNDSAFNSKGVWGFDNLQDFMNNRAANFQLALDVASFNAIQWQQGYFLQDDFKFSKNLTFNLGFRYETFDMPFGAFGAEDAAIRATLVPGPSRADRNNWSGRLGFAWSPEGGIFGNGKTVIRGGFGSFYDYLFFNIHTVTASNFPRVRTALLDRPVNLFPRQQTGAAPGFDPRLTYVNAPENLQAPANHTWSLSIQREFGKNILEVGYTGNRSTHGIRQGQANPGILTAEQAALVRSTNNPNAIPGLPGVSGPASRRLVPTFGSRVLIESTAFGRYNAGYVKFDRRLSRGLLVGANYTYSSNFSDNDESLGVGAITASSPQIPQNFFDYRSEWSRSVFDRPNRFAVFWTYELPILARMKSNSFARNALGGWNLNGSFDAQSGQPFTLFSSVDLYGTGGTAGRPDLNQGGTMTADNVTGNFRTFTLPLDGSGRVTTQINPATRLPLANSRSTFGNLGRNTFRGPGFAQWNLTASKNIRITERINTSFRADFINAFNVRNFGNPIANIASPQLGTNTSDPGNRQVLLSLKVRF
ncbi:MAG: carboxypeptidase regulatory-like domain-containing protein [Acidobacteriota bacterium]